MLGRARQLACLVSVFAAACGGGGAPAASELELTAHDGPYEGTLMIEPSPHVGQHDVVLVLNRDPDSGEPLEGASVLVSPWMPAHGHGSVDVEALEAEPGVYVAKDVWLNMPGIWDLRVHVEADEPGELTATLEVP